LGPVLIFSRSSGMGASSFDARASRAPVSSVIAPGREGHKRSAQRVDFAPLPLREGQASGICL